MKEIIAYFMMVIVLVPFLIIYATAVYPYMEDHPVKSGVLNSLVSGNAVRKNMDVMIRVRINGHIVYEKVGDPITDNWLSLVVNTFFGTGKYDPLSYYDISGIVRTSTIYSVTASSDLGLYAYLGTGTAASYSDYRLSSPVKSWFLATDPFVIYDNGSVINVTIIASYVAETDGEQYSEVGLAIKFHDGGTAFQVLIFHDVFPSVSLNQSDSLSIAWIILIRYDEPPLVKELWYRIISLGLGGARYDHDFGYTFGASYRNSYIYIGFVTSDIDWAYNLTYSVISSYIVLSPALDAGAIERYASSQKIVVGGVRNAGVNVLTYGIAAIVDNNGNKYIIAYWPLQEPINISADSLVKVWIEIMFNGP